MSPLRATIAFLALLYLGIATGHTQPLLLVLNKSDNTLTFIDATRMTALQTVRTGTGPHELCVSDDGKLAFIANYGSQQQPGNTITVVDIAQRKEAEVINLGAISRPHGLTFRSGKLYVTSESSRAVFRYDVASKKVDWIMGTGQSGTHMLALAPDNQKLYTANRVSNTVSVFTLGAQVTPESLKHIEMGPGPEAISITPDGSEVWVGQNGDGAVAVISTTAGRVEKKIAVGKVPMRLKITHDGKYALVSDSQAGELIVIDVKSREIIRRVTVGGGPVGLVISPDNRYVFVALPQLNAISKIDLQTFKETGRVTTGSNPDGIAFVGAQ